MPSSELAQVRKATRRASYCLCTASPTATKFSPASVRDRWTGPSSSRGVFFSLASDEPLHRPTMQLDVPLARQPPHQLRNREGRLGRSLRPQERHDVWGALDRPHAPGSPITQPGDTAPGKPPPQDVERLAAVAEPVAHGGDRLTVHHVGPQHLVFDLQFIAGVEERRMLPKQLRSNPGPGGVEGALLLERPPLVGGASCHGRELLAATSHGREDNVNIYKPHMVWLNGPPSLGPRMRPPRHPHSPPPRPSSTEAAASVAFINPSRAPADAQGASVGALEEEARLRHISLDTRPT